MILDDQLLLSRYAASRDAEAFAELVGRYSTMVYAVACRVTGNVAVAEDVTQDCFLTLARQAAVIRGSLPAWLHRVALNRSLEVARSDASRYQRERRVSSSKPGDEATWKEMMPVVDAALAELPEELREPLVQRFLLGRTQVQVAQALGVNQATVSRRITEGIERLRGHLRRTGLVCGAVVLATGLAQSASAAVPAALSASLGKMAIVGPAKAATGGTIATVLAAHAKLIAAIAAAMVGIGALSYQLAPKMGIFGGSTTVSGGGTIPYLSGLALQGDGVVQDSFSLTFQAAARACGREADYETVYALSTNAFCPAIVGDMQEGRAYWHVQAWMGDRAIGTLAARYGLAARDLRQPNAAGNAETYRKLLGPGIAEAISAGSAVVTTSGWHTGSVNPGWAGIVTETRPDGSIFGVTMNGRSEDWLDVSGGIWALSPTAEAMSPHEADAATLRSAIARIRGQGPYQAKGQSVYGLAAMDTWIKTMSETPGFCKCKNCQASIRDASKRPRNSAFESARTMQSASKVAATWLRKIAGDFPAEAQIHIESAAGHYEHIAALLAPAIGTGPDSYGAFIGDLSRQKVHAATVLVQVRSEYAAIAQDLELALSARQ